MKIQSGGSRAYRFASVVILVILAILFTFPLYWIITGAFKPGADINSVKPVWWPSQWVPDNFNNLLNKRSANLWQLAIPFSNWFSDNGQLLYWSVGPEAPAAFRWLINAVFMAVAAMVITCLTAAMAGYALAKKRFNGRALLFSLIVCAMALPKQVILPTVGWPVGVFLMKQFSEGIPGEILEASRIDGSSEWNTFYTVVMPMIKPGIGALAIFTFINCWNDYFMQLVMLDSNSVYTIPLGIATLQAETSTDIGLLMAGAALASIPIIVVFLAFQKYFTQGIAMGAVKG